LAVVAISGKFLELFWYFGKLISREQGIFIERSFFKILLANRQNFATKK
jgi:hypothetical protein